MAPCALVSGAEGAAIHLDLDLLAITYRLRSNSARWLALMQQLWQRFVTEVDRPMFSLDMNESDGGVELLLPGVEPHTLGDPWLVINSLKYWLVDHALRNSPSTLAIHAALLEKEDARALLVGASRAGKTTLCLELLERGWRYGSDDLAPVVAGDGRVMVFPRPLAVRDAELWDRYVERWSPAAWLPAPTEAFQLPSALFEEMAPGLIEPTHVFFIDSDHGRGFAAAPRSRAFAAAQLSQYVRWVGEPDLGSLAKLSRTVEPWALRYETPTEGADGVARACFG